MWTRFCDKLPPEYYSGRLLVIQFEDGSSDTYPYDENAEQTWAEWHETNLEAGAWCLIDEYTPPPVEWVVPTLSDLAKGAVHCKCGRAKGEEQMRGRLLSINVADGSFYVETWPGNADWWPFCVIERPLSNVHWPSDAPEWANWLAMDESSDWYYYESKPKIEKDFWCPDGRFRSIDLPRVDDWKTSLIKRPSNA